MMLAATNPTQRCWTKRRRFPPFCLFCSPVLVVFEERLFWSFLSLSGSIFCPCPCFKTSTSTTLPNICEVGREFTAGSSWSSQSLLCHRSFMSTFTFTVFKPLMSSCGFSFFPSFSWGAANWLWVDLGQLGNTVSKIGTSESVNYVNHSLSNCTACNSTTEQLAIYLCKMCWSLIQNQKLPSALYFQIRWRPVQHLFGRPWKIAELARWHVKTATALQ